MELISKLFNSSYTHICLFSHFCKFILFIIIYFFFLLKVICEFSSQRLHKSNILAPKIKNIHITPN